MEQLFGIVEKRKVGKTKMGKTKAFVFKKLCEASMKATPGKG